MAFTVSVTIEVLTPEPPHHVVGQKVAFPILFVRWPIERIVEHRVQQQLKHKRCETPLLRHQGSDSREVGARALAANRYSSWVAMKGSGVKRSPASRGITIICRRRKLVFRSETIVRRNHDAAGQIRQRTARSIDSLDTAYYPTAAVEVDEHGEGSTTIGCIDPQRQISGGTAERAIFNLGDALWFARGGTHRLYRFTRLYWWQVMQRWSSRNHLLKS